MRNFLACAAFILTVILVIPLAGVVAESPNSPVRQDVLANIESPLPNSAVQGRVQVKGSALHPQFDFYKVEFGPGENPSDDQMAIIGAIHEEQVASNVLETWDTTLIPDGTYTLRLRVVDVTGNYQEFWVRRLSVNNSSPTPTSTSVATSTPSPPTPTPTIILPSPTIVVEQPFLDLPTATPPPPPTVEAPPPSQPEPTVIETEPTPIPTPAPTSTPAPALTDLVQPQAFGNALCVGALFMAGIFLFFGVLSGARHLLLSFLDTR